MCAEKGHGVDSEPGEAERDGELECEESQDAASVWRPARAAAPGAGDSAAPTRWCLREWELGAVRDVIAARGLEEPAARQAYVPRRVLPAPRRGLTGAVPEWWWAGRPRRELCEVRTYYCPRRRQSSDALAGFSLMGPSSLRLWFVPVPGLPRRWARG